MAGQASPLPHALHPDLVLLAQPGRALLSRCYRLHHCAQLRIDRRTVGCDHRLSRRAQQKCQAIRLARQGRGYPSQDRGGTAGHGREPNVVPMLGYLRDTTLAPCDGAVVERVGDGAGPPPLLNSASLERLEALAMARDHRASVVVTAAGEKGMPADAGERVANATRMIEAALAQGFAP